MIKLKKILKESSERDTKKFIKKLKYIQRQLNNLIKSLDSYKQSNRAIKEDFWRVNNGTVNSIEDGVKDLGKLFWPKWKIARKNYDKKYNIR